LILDRLDHVVKLLDRMPPGVVAADDDDDDDDDDKSHHLHHASSEAIALAMHADVSSCVGPDTVLEWPTFSGKFASGMFNAAVLGRPPRDVVHNDNFKEHPTAWPPDTLFDDVDLVAQLVRRFLHNVHVKNPMMDVRKVARLVPDLAGKRPGWNERSCLLVRRPPQAFCLCTHDED
jgi:hypothetical protein